MNVLISSAGRRVGLLRAFRRALADGETPGRVLAVDSSPHSAALQEADDGWLVPRCTDPSFIPTMLDLCERENVGLVVPTIDTELETYARHRRAFADLSTMLAVSSPETVRIAGDKLLTNRHFVRSGIPAARQWTVDEVGSAPDAIPFPVVVKPRRGSAGIGVHTIADASALRHAWSASTDVVVESFLPGDEYTVNVYVNGLGECIAAVPHRRLEVRAGEVSKGFTVRDEGLIAAARRAIESLPGAFGALCLQAKLDPCTGLPRFFEINARFGGGFPLALAAGADFARYLVRDALGDPVRHSVTDWVDGLAMLRYDEPVFLPLNEIEERAAWSPTR